MVNGLGECVVSYHDADGEVVLCQQCTGHPGLEVHVTATPTHTAHLTQSTIIIGAQSAHAASSLKCLYMRMGLAMGPHAPDVVHGGEEVLGHGLVQGPQRVTLRLHHLQKTTHAVDGAEAPLVR